MSLAGSQREHTQPGLIRSEQNRTRAADVVHREPTRRAIDQAFFARKIQCINRPRRSAGYSRKPDFLAIRTPRQSFYAGIKRRTDFWISMRIKNDDAAIVTTRDMIRDGNRSAVRRESHMTYPALRFIDHVVDGIFQMREDTGSSANNCQRLPFGRQSAHITFSSTSRGAPPASATRAKVPVCVKCANGVGCRQIAI